jgi:hypothetical protein
MASIADEARASALALDLFAGLIDDLDRHALDAWEPALAAQTLRSYARSLRSAQAAESVTRPIVSRLSRLDPAAAFELSRTKDATPPKTVR